MSALKGEWKAEGPCTRGDAGSFRHDEKKRGQATQSSLSCPRTADSKRREKTSEREISPRPQSFWKGISRRPYEDYLSGNCTNPSCNFGHPPRISTLQNTTGMQAQRGCRQSAKQMTEKNGGKGCDAFIEEFLAIRLRIPEFRSAEIQVDFTERHKILGT